MSILGIPLLPIVFCTNQQFNEFYGKNDVSLLQCRGFLHNCRFNFDYDFCVLVCCGFKITISNSQSKLYTFISLRRQFVIISSFLANVWQFMTKQSLVGNTDIQYQKQVELWILHLFETPCDFPCDFTYLNNGSVFNELADQIFRRQGAASRQA